MRWTSLSSYNWNNNSNFSFHCLSLVKTGLGTFILKYIYVPLFLFSHVFEFVSIVTILFSWFLIKFTCVLFSSSFTSVNNQ